MLNTDHFINLYLRHRHLQEVPELPSEAPSTGIGSSSTYEHNSKIDTGAFVETLFINIGLFITLIAFFEVRMTPIIYSAYLYMIIYSTSSQYTPLL
jgi:hypothetical protein